MCCYPPPRNFDQLRHNSPKYIGKKSVETVTRQIKREFVLEKVSIQVDVYYSSSSIQGLSKGNVKRIGVSSQQEELWGDDENLSPNRVLETGKRISRTDKFCVARQRRSFSLSPFYFNFFLIYFVYLFFFPSSIKSTTRGRKV